MDNYKVILEEFTRNGQPRSISRVVSNYNHPWDTVFYEDFIEKTIEFLKDYYWNQDHDVAFDFEEAANDLLVGISLIRGYSLNVLKFAAFLDKQYSDSYYYDSNEEYRRYTKSSEKERKNG